MTDVFADALAAVVSPKIAGYELLRPLGQGADCRVDLARDARGRDVAIKRWLDPDLPPADRARLEREVELLGRVEHEHLVRLVELTKDDRGAPCLVLEHVDGTTLAELIRQAGRLEARRAAEVGAALARALGALHAQGIVHRDVKPANVVVRSRDKRPVLIDLGVALLRGPAVAPDDDGRGDGAGTFPYMAPEQLGAEVPGGPAPPVDARADLYGLGALLFECVTGLPPWTTQGPWVRRNRDPWLDPVFPEVRARAEEVPPALRRVIATCLAGDPAERPADAATLAAQLDALARGAGGDDAPAAPPRQRVLTVVAARLPGDGEARDEVRALVARHDGHELARAGPEVVASFEAPSAAVAFGLRLLHALPVRLGLTWGEVSEDPGALEPEGRLVGLTIEAAARLAALAAPRQLLLSAGALDEARANHAARPGDLPEIAWRAYGPYVLRGLLGEDRELSLGEVGLVGVSPLAAPADTGAARRVEASDELPGWRPAPGLQIPRRPHWVLERRLGEGGFGEVWLAAHATTRDRRAFKFCFRADRLRQLKREVVIFTLLRDTLDKRWDIAQILDWQFDEAPYFIESEYSPNGSFVDWARAQGGLERVPLELRVELVAQVADALGAAHGVGVLHKDVKPQNILIASFGSAWTAQLADFGVGVLDARARQVARTARATKQLTTAPLTEMLSDGGAEAFSRLYMAPELLEGAEASQASDVYALGVVLFQAVRGDLGKALGAGWERWVEDPLLREDIAACVDVDPTRRLDKADELARRLRHLDERRAARERDEQARRTAELLQVAEQLQRQRRRWLLLVLAFALLALWGFRAAAAAREEAAELRRELETLRRR